MSYGAAGVGVGGGEDKEKQNTISYVKQIASPGSMPVTGCSGLGHWDDPEGWDGEGGSGWRTHVHPWLIHMNVLQTHNIVK